MSTLRRAVIVLVLCCCPVAGAAQTVRRILDPEGMMASARQSLRVGNYAAARAQAASVLDIGTLRRDERIRALQVAAAAYYPARATEQDTEQYKDEAFAYLRQLAEEAVCMARPPEPWWWPGLDTLYRTADSLTFAFAMEPLPADTTLVGRSVLPIRVCSNRRVNVELVVEDEIRTGQTVWMDRADNVRRPVFRLSVLDGDTLRISSGEYTVRLTATDPSTGERRERRYRIGVDAPPLPPDTAQARVQGLLRRPQTPARPAHIRRAGFLVGVATALVPAIDFFRRDANRPYNASALAAGAGIFGASLWIARRDKPADIPGNIAYNRALEEYRRRAREAQLAGYVAVVRYFGEER